MNNHRSKYCDLYEVSHGLPLPKIEGELTKEKVGNHVSKLFKNTDPENIEILTTFLYLRMKKIRNEFCDN